MPTAPVLARRQRAIAIGHAIGSTTAELTTSAISETMAIPASHPWAAPETARPAAMAHRASWDVENTERDPAWEWNPPGYLTPGQHPTAQTLVATVAPPGPDLPQPELTCPSTLASSIAHFQTMAAAAPPDFAPPVDPTASPKAVRSHPSLGPWRRCEPCPVKAPPNCAPLERMLWATAPPTTPPTIAQTVMAPVPVDPPTAPPTTAPTTPQTIVAPFDDDPTTTAPWVPSPFQVEVASRMIAVEARMVAVESRVMAMDERVVAVEDRVIAMDEKAGLLLVNLGFWISEFQIFNYRDLLFSQNNFGKYVGEISRNK